MASSQAIAGHQTLTSRAHIWQREVCKHSYAPLKFEDSFLDRLIRPKYSNRSRRCWVLHLGLSLLWSHRLGGSCPSAKVLPSLLCTVSSIGLLRQSETFWIHTVCSSWGPTKREYFMPTYSEHLMLCCSLFYFLFTWK